MLNSDWTAWLGLPHAFGADPDNGQGADCLVMVWKLLAAAGVHHPPLDPRWLDLAAAGRWEELKTVWQEKTQPLPRAENHAVTLFKNGKAGLGVGIVVNGGLLIVHHRRGVCWVPLAAMKPLTYCSFR